MAKEKIILVEDDLSVSHVSVTPSWPVALMICC